MCARLPTRRGLSPHSGEGSLLPSAELTDPDTLRHFIAHIAEGVYITTPAGQFIDANPALVEMLGAESIEELQQYRAEKLYVDPTVREQESALIEEAHGWLRDFPLTLRRLDGTEFEAQDTVYAVRDESGKVTAYHGILTDVGKRVRTKGALRHERQYLAALIESSPFPIVMLDLDNKIMDCNPAFEELFLYARTEVIGELLDEVVVPSHERSQARAWTNRVQSGERSSREVRLLRSDGSTVPVEVHGVPVTVDGEQVGVYAIYKDLSDHEAKEERIQRQFQRMEALSAIDQAITNSLDLGLTLRVVLDQVKSELEADAVGIVLFDAHTQLLEYAAARGFRNPIEGTKFRLGESRAGRAVLTRRIVSNPNLTAAPADLVLQSPSVAEEDFVAYHAAPLISKGAVNGVLEVYYRSPFTPEPGWFRFFKALATRTAIAIDNANLFEDLQRSKIDLTFAYDSALEGWSRALELRDIETEGHTIRVTEMTLCLARAMGLGKEELVHVRRGSLLHDIGKMAIPDNILLKKGPLSDGEWEIMRSHPVYAYSMLSPIPYLRPALDIPYSHHERWDGNGYPRGLMADQISLAARIFAVSDVWDALNSDRPYREAWPAERVLKHIRQQSGKHFDPAVVDVFTDLKREPTE